MIAVICYYKLEVSEATYCGCVWRLTLLRHVRTALSALLASGWQWRRHCSVLHIGGHRNVDMRRDGHCPRLSLMGTVKVESTRAEFLPARCRHACKGHGTGSAMRWAVLHAPMEW